MGKKELEQAHKDIDYINYMLKEEGQSYAERYYRVIVLSYLISVLDSLRFIRTLLCVLIGTLIAHLFVG